MENILKKMLTYFCNVVILYCQNKKGEKNMTVYVLSQVWQCDSGECGNEINVFETFEKAHDEFCKCIIEAREDFDDLETEESNYVDGDMSWSIWEKEEYCYNHIDLAIREREVL